MTRDEEKRVIDTRCARREHDCANASQEKHRSCCESLRPNARRSEEANEEEQYVQKWSMVVSYLVHKRDKQVLNLR